jgi:hypothetical protein
MPCTNLLEGKVTKKPNTKPRCSASIVPIAGVALRTRSKSPVTLTRTSITVNACSIPRPFSSRSAGSRFAFAKRSPAGPMTSPIPPSVPSTTGRSYQA